MTLKNPFRQPSLWAAVALFGGLATLLAAGCGGSDDAPLLNQKQHARNVNVSAVKSLGAGRAMPFAGLMATRPPGPAAPAMQGAVAFNPSLGLYPGSPTVSGNTQTTPYFTDAALTVPAGSISYATPGSTYNTTYTSYPAVVVMDFDITAGRMPTQGTVEIEYLSHTGANNMTGELTLTSSNVVINIDMNLNDAQDVGGEMDFTVLGVRTRFFNLEGKVNSDITGDVEVPSLSWTGTGTINFITGAFSTQLNTGAGVVNASLDSEGHLDIGFGDGSTEEITDPITEPIVGGGGATNGGTNTNGGNTTGTNTTGTNTTGTNTTGTNTTGTNNTGSTTSGTEYGTPIVTTETVNAFSNDERMVGANSSNVRYWSSPTATPITPPLPAGTSSSTMLDVNSSGEMVGQVRTNGGSTVGYYYWSSPTATPVLVKMPDGFTTAVVKGINEEGEMVGNGVKSFVTYPLYWASPDAVPVELALPDGQTRGDADDINDAGQILGHCPPSGIGGSAYVWTSDTAVPQAVPLGTGTRFSANGINNNGIVSGTIFTTDNRPATWTIGSANPVMLPILAGDDSGAAFGINDDNEVVGYSMSPGNVASGIIWRNGAIVRINTLFNSSGWDFQRAFLIGNNGTIIGDGKQGTTDRDFILVKN